MELKKSHTLKCSTGQYQLAASVF
uniref:Phosphatidate cytidylyltransferase family protein n=1 Tax=Arundo donax TaxID=35708 RepID=A0A0A9HFR3_ARUDO